MRKIAYRIGEYCYQREWIAADCLPILVYSLEKRILMFIFLSVIFLWAAVAKCIVEVLSFLSTFLLLRRRAGGIHAKTPIGCFITSIALVVVITKMIGPIFYLLPKAFTITIFVGVSITYFFTVPAYPDNLHFSDEEKNANRKRKNELIVVLFSLLCGALAAGLFRLFFYSLLGILVSLVTVYLEKIKQKGVD